jgi:hypothetical protein
MIPHSAKINTYQKSEARSQKSEVRSQKSEVRSQKSEVRSQKSEVRSQIIVAASGGFYIFKRKAPHYSDFCICLVEVNGFEPMTSCVQGRRSPS